LLKICSYLRKPGWLTSLPIQPLLLGLVSAAQGIPQFGLSVFSGVIIDRRQKRDVIKISQAATIVNTLSIAILITIGQIQYWNLLISAFLNGVINAFNIP
jgi:MFS family permease